MPHRISFRRHSWSSLLMCTCSLSKCMHISATWQCKHTNMLCLDLGRGSRVWLSLLPILTRSIDAEKKLCLDPRGDSEGVALPTPPLTGSTQEVVARYGSPHPTSFWVTNTQWNKNIDTCESNSTTIPLHGYGTVCDRFNIHHFRHAAFVRQCATDIYLISKYQVQQFIC